MASPGSGDELLRGIAARLMARQSAGSFGKPSESGPKAEPKPKPVPGKVSSSLQPSTEDTTLLTVAVNPTGHLRTIQRENIAPMANTGPSTFGTAEQLAVSSTSAYHLILTHSLTHSILGSAKV